MKMYSTISLLSLLATVVMVVSQDSVSETHLPGGNTAVLFKCVTFLNSANLGVTQTSELLPLTTLCHPNMEKYYDCMLADVYKSNASIDIQIRSITDLSKAKGATRSLCQKAAKLNKETRFCNVSSAKCQSTFQPPKNINLDSPLFCQAIEDKRCTFNEFAKCDLQRTMLWAKYQKESQSIGCLLADPKFQLIPSYGPEIKCYSSINIDDIKRTDYSQIYERYCEQFNYTEVSSCVEETLSNITSEELWEDKESYLNKARKFVNDRQTLCRNMTTLSSLKCLNPAHKPDVSNCQKMLFIQLAPSNYSISDYIKYYGYCVWTMYYSCNIDFGLLIYINLISYFV